MGKPSPSSRIKARILAEYPRFSIKRERLVKKHRDDLVTFTRATLVTSAGNVFASGDGPDFTLALRNLAWRTMVRLDEAEDGADG